RKAGPPQRGVGFLRGVLHQKHHLFPSGRKASWSGSSSSGSACGSTFPCASTNEATPAPYRNSRLPESRYQLSSAERRSVLKTKPWSINHLGIMFVASLSLVKRFL